MPIEIKLLIHHMDSSLKLLAGLFQQAGKIFLMGAIASVICLFPDFL